MSTRLTYNPPVTSTPPIGPPSAFGEQVTVEPTPAIQLDFSQGEATNPRIVTNSTTGTGTVVTTDGQAVISSGATAQSLARLETNLRAKYHPGQGTYVAFTARFSAPVAGGFQRIGIGNDEDGLFFGYEGTTFGVTRLSGGKKQIHRFTFTAPAAGNGNITFTVDGDAKAVAVLAGDSIQEVARKVTATDFSAVGTGWEVYNDGTSVLIWSFLAEAKPGAFSFVDTDATGVTATLLEEVDGAAPTRTTTAQTAWSEDTRTDLIHANGSPYKIDFQYLGFGEMYYYIEKIGGEFGMVHKEDYANTSTETSIHNPTLPLFIEVHNGAATTDLSISSGSMAVGTQGKISPMGLNFPTNNVKAISTTNETPIFSIKVKELFGGIENRVNIQPLLLSVSGAGAGACKEHIFRVRTNGILDGPTVFTDISTPTSVVSVDTAATGISGGNEVLTFDFGKTIEAYALNVERIATEQPPGTLISITCEIDGGTTDARGALLWKELF